MFTGHWLVTAGSSGFQPLCRNSYTIKNMFWHASNYICRLVSVYNVSYTWQLPLENPLLLSWIREGRNHFLLYLAYKVQLQSHKQYTDMVSNYVLPHSSTPQCPQECSLFPTRILKYSKLFLNCLSMIAKQMVISPLWIKSLSSVNNCYSYRSPMFHNLFSPTAHPNFELRK
jgi:hypothetical protein